MVFYKELIKHKYSKHRQDTKNEIINSFTSQYSISKKCYITLMFNNKKLLTHSQVIKQQCKSEKVTNQMNLPVFLIYL